MEIARVANQASEKINAEAEERVREAVGTRENTTKIAVEKAATEVRAGAEDEGVDRERVEAEARAWDETDII